MRRMPDPDPRIRKAPGFGVWRGQLAPPGEWAIWLYCAGRGSGKTRTGAEQIRRWANDFPECRIALVGATAADVWGTMVEGDSGVLACCPPWDRPEVHTTKRRLRWRNRSQAILYSADKPKRLRGPQHHFAWADELCSWRYLEAYDQLMFGLRLGLHPKVMVTTTPLPIDLLREMIQSPEAAVTIGSSRENGANLSPDFFRRIVKKYEGTHLGLQELEGELLEQSPGALWKKSWFRYVETPPVLKRIVLGLDPAETSGKKADDTGIVICAVGEDGFGYVLEDASVHTTPDAWAKKAAERYRFHHCGSVVVDAVRGGEMAKGLLHLVDPNIRVLVKGGNRGKRAWAEPVSALYEQGRIKHLATIDQETNRKLVARMEDQMCTWTDDVKEWSPDRMDAAVYALSELLLRDELTHESMPSTPRRTTW